MITNAKWLFVKASVRYWEDAVVNGVTDTDGRRIPLRVGNDWLVVIELATGRISQWPKGTKAIIKYKVCDEGQYWLGDAGGSTIAKWKGYYVPGTFLCHGGRGHGDYIILNVNGDGMIEAWKVPTILDDEWEAIVPAPKPGPKAMVIETIRGNIEEAGDCLPALPGEDNGERPGLMIAASRAQIAGCKNLLFKRVVVLLADDYDALVRRDSLTNSATSGSAASSH